MCGRGDATGCSLISVIAPPDPLPDWLIRLLNDPADRSFAPTRGDRPRGDRASGEARMPARRAGDALDGAIVKGFAFGVSGLVWVAVLVMTTRHFLH
jgi:hypothetical protein